MTRKLKTKIKFSIVLIINLIVIIGCDLRTSQSYFDEACKLEDEGKYEEAILCLDKVIMKNPKALEAYISRGVDKSALGRYREAIEDYEKVIKQDSNNILAIVNKANNLKRLQEYEEAIVFYNKAIELNGGERTQIHWINKSVLYAEEFNYDVPSVEIQYQRAFTYYEIDSFNLALKGFRYCVSNNYMKKEALNEIGNLLYVSGQLEEACKYFNQSASLGDEKGKSNFNEFCKTNKATQNE